jgi:hypothetical protein
VKWLPQGAGLLTTNLWNAAVFELRCVVKYGIHEGAIPPASKGICCSDLVTAVIAEIAVIILRKDKVVAQF